MNLKVNLNFKNKMFEENQQEIEEHKEREGQQIKMKNLNLDEESFKNLKSLLRRYLLWTDESFDVLTPQGTEVARIWAKRKLKIITKILKVLALRITLK